MDHLKLTHDHLSVDTILKLVSSEKCGAVSIFVGTTRDNFEGKKVIKLEYEAYETMALKVMQNICSEIRQKWDQVHNIAIYHRLGEVPVLEASVVIAISSPHRMDSMNAVQYCIQNLKGLDLNCFDNEIKDNAKLSVKRKFNEDSSVVQINASNEELKMRIEKFCQVKREQINLSNIQDFISCHNNTKRDSEDSCARVDAIFLKRKDSKSHLKVMRIDNEWGPMTRIEKINPKPNVSSTTPISDGIEERLSNAEKKLNISKPIPSNVYSRLKNIEEKILQLESISPEYSTFWVKNSNSDSTEDFYSRSPVKKFKFSADYIREKLEEFHK